MRFGGSGFFFSCHGEAAGTCILDLELLAFSHPPVLLVWSYGSLRKLVLLFNPSVSIRVACDI